MLQNIRALANTLTLVAQLHQARAVDQHWPAAELHAGGAGSRNSGVNPVYNLLALTLG